MKKTEFNRLFKRVNGKAHANAPVPEFVACAINESEFEHDCRVKSCTIDLDEVENRVTIDWTSQGDCTEHMRFLQEILRCFREALRFDGDIHVHICSRHDEDNVFSYYF